MKRIITTLPIAFLISAVFIVVIGMTPTAATAADLAITFNVSHYQNGSNISCHGANDGMVEAVIVGGVFPYSYSWNIGSFNRTLTGLGGGTYTFTVTDAAGQTISASVDLIQPQLLEMTLLPSIFAGYNISSQGGNNGEIKSELKGGAPPYSYAWSTGSTNENLSELTAGNYSLTVTDANGCTVSGSKTMTEPTPLHVVSLTSPLHNGYNISCKEGHNGAINLEVAGGVPPYKYDWSNGSFNEDLTDLSAGEYSVRIFDSNEAKIITSIILTEPSGYVKVTLTPQVYANGFNLSCHDCANGSLTAVGNGGVLPYTFLWSNAQTISTISGLQAKEYKCTITDANGCTNTEAFLLRAPDRDDWSMNGNANTDPVTQFMGTTDNKDFVLKTNNVERVRIKGTGVVEVKNGIKLDSTSTDSLRAVYVDQTGVLRTARSGSGSNCVGPVNAWLTNYCNVFPGNIYLQPGLGMVGVGTSSPTAKLDVVGDIQSSTLAGAGFNLLQSNNTGKISLVSTSVNPSNEILFGDGIWRSLPSGVNSWIFNNGYIYNSSLTTNVGIGITNPEKLLTVAGETRLVASDGGNGLEILPNGLVPTRRGISLTDQVVEGAFNFYINDYQVAPSFNFIRSGSNVSNLLRIQGDGKIGINSRALDLSEDQKFTVNGGVRFVSDVGVDALEIKSTVNNVPPKRRGISLDDDGVGSFNFHIHDYQSQASFNFVSTQGNNSLLSLMRIQKNGKIGIRNSDPKELLSLGNEFVFHDGGSKVIARNFYFGAGEPRKLISGPSSALSFESTGDLRLRTSVSGNQDDVIQWVNGIHVSNGGQVGIGGDADPQYALNINGTINAHDLRIDGAALSTLFNQWQTNGNDVFYSGGKVGIGTSTPDMELNVSGAICATTGNTAYNYGLYCRAGNDYSKAIVVERNGRSNFLVYGNGNAFARGLWITYDDFPDYVFEKNYCLLDFASLKKYIADNGHLPNLPKRADVLSNPFSVGELQIKTLEKVEELYLYVLQLKEENDKLHDEISKLKN